jgi:hypothetical protein
MFRRPNRLLLAAGVSVAIIAAMTGTAGTGARAAALPSPLTLAGPVTLTYSATTSDNDTCSGECFEWGYQEPVDFTSYTEAAASTLSAQITLSGTAVQGKSGGLSGSGTLDESGATFHSTGSYSGVYCGTSAVTTQGTTPGTASAGLSVITSASGTPDLSLSFGGDEELENILITETDCDGSSGTATTTIQDTGEDVTAVDQALGLGDITGWTLNQSWTPDTGGTLATKTISGSAPWPATSPPQADKGTMNATQTWTVSTSPCSSATSASSGSPDAARAAPSSCGLSITSPPDNSVVALTNGTYVQPQPAAANNVAPAHRFLIVDGTTPCPVVTVNGVAASVTGDSWEAKLPIHDLGPLTLTADASKTTPGASDCGQVTSDTTLINLEITSPADDGDVLPVSVSPDMPDVDAKVQVQGYAGDTSAVTFNWTLDVLGEYVNRSGWHAYDQPYTGNQTGTSSSWSPDFSSVIGGWGRLVVTASLPGVDGTVSSDPRWINITGTNPGRSAVENYIYAYASQFPYTVMQIDCLESNHTFNQFNPDQNAGEPQAPGVPDSLADQSVLRPLFGAPPAGIGIAQLDPATFPFENWNWKLNVSSGIDEFNFDYDTATTLTARTQATLDAQYKQLWTSLNAQRSALGKPLLPYKPVTVRALSDTEVLYDAIRLYNYSGGEYLFDLTYHQGPGLTIATSGTGTWIQNTGGSDPNYVHQVLSCLI